MEQDLCNTISDALTGQVVAEVDCDDIAFYLHFDNDITLIFEGWVRLLNRETEENGPEGAV